MGVSAAAAYRGRRAFLALLAVSAAFVVVTFMSFAFEGPGSASRLLFWLGLAGENNVGAWWSGMLLLLAAVLAFDGFATPLRSARERRGWLALAAMLAVLSFDEIASLHEHLSNTSDLYIAAFALVVLVLAVYALAALYRGDARREALWLIAAAFSLFALVPVQEYIQQTREWPNPVIYGLRAALEEGTEIAAMLLLIAAAGRYATRAGPIGRGSRYALLTSYHGAVMLSAAVLLPLVVAGTYLLPSPSGAADWLASSLYLCGALLAVSRPRRPSSGGLAAPAACGWFVLASVGSNAVALNWDPEVLGGPISLRGLLVTAILASAVVALRFRGRMLAAVLLAAALLALFLARRWPDSQLLWYSLPPLGALWVFALEGRAYAAERVAAERVAAERVAAERVAGGGAAPKARRARRASRRIAPI